MGGGVPNTRERARQPASRRELLFAFCYCFVFLSLFANEIATMIILTLIALTNLGEESACKMLCRFHEMLLLSRATRVS